MSNSPNEGFCSCVNAELENKFGVDCYILANNDDFFSYSLFVRLSKRGPDDFFSVF